VKNTNSECEMSEHSNTHTHTHTDALMLCTQSYIYQNTHPEIDTHTHTATNKIIEHKLNKFETSFYHLITCITFYTFLLHCLLLQYRPISKSSTSSQMIKL